MLPLLAYFFRKDYIIQKEKQLCGFIMKKSETQFINFLVDTIAKIETAKINFEMIRETPDDFRLNTGQAYHSHHYHELKLDLNELERGQCRAVLVAPHVMHGFTSGHIILNCNRLSTFLCCNCSGNLRVINIPLSKNGGNLFNDLLEILLNIPLAPRFAPMHRRTLSLLFCNLQIMLGMLTESDEKLQSVGSLTDQAIFFMERHYHQSDLSISSIAENLGISQQYLSRCFRQQFQITPRRKLIEIRLERAQQLLQSGRYLIKDIAKLCGWKNQFYFSNAYRKHFGRPPRS